MIKVIVIQIEKKIIWKIKKNNDDDENGDVKEKNKQSDPGGSADHRKVFLIFFYSVTSIDKNLRFKKLFCFFFQSTRKRHI